MYVPGVTQGSDYTKAIKLTVLYSATQMAGATDSSIHFRPRLALPESLVHLNPLEASTRSHRMLLRPPTTHHPYN